MKRQKKSDAARKFPARKAKEQWWGGEREKRKKSRLEILLPAHARSSQANILNLDIYCQTVTKNGSAIASKRVFRRNSHRRKGSVVRRYLTEN